MSLHASQESLSDGFISSKETNLPVKPKLASLGYRLVAHIIDGTVGSAIMVVILACLFLQNDFTFQEFYFEYLKSAASGTGIFIHCSLYFLVLNAMIQGVFMRLRSQTVGKWLMGIKVVDARTGGDAGFFRGYVVRTFAFSALVNLISICLPGSFFPYLLTLMYYVGILFIFGAARRTLFDRLAGTQVIQIRR